MRTLKTFRQNRDAEKRRKHAEKMARWREAKRLKRESSVEPIRQEWRGKFVFTLTVHNRLSGKLTALDFYLSEKRINSFRVELDGKPWRKQISMSDALAKVRKSIPKFSVKDSE